MKLEVLPIPSPAPIEPALLNALILAQYDGHALKYSLASNCVTFTSEWTTPDDVLRLRAAYPVLDKLTVRCEIEA